MSDGNKLLSPVNCERGAPMGRSSIRENLSAKVRLFRVRFIDGAYDCGGAYWGSGNPLYAAIGDGFRDFCRANDREDAKSKFIAKYPDLKFYR